MRIRRMLMVLVVLIALAAAGCSSTSAPTSPVAEVVADTTEAVDTADVAETTTEDEAVTSSDEPAAADANVSPLAEALGVSLDEFAQANVTYERDAQELTRECMAEAGFDYTITQSGINEAFRRQLELRNSLTEEQFAEQYGFGIATLFELNFQGQGVVNFANQQFGPPPTVPRSSGEQAAYELALNGETTQGLSPEEAQEQLFGTGVGNAAEGSCREYGYSTAVNPGSAYDGLFSILGDEFEALNDRWESDPRVRSALADWQTCMAAKGHAYEDQFEIVNELDDRSNDLANQYLTSPQVLTALGQAQEQDFVTMNSDDRYAFLETAGALQGFSWVPEVQVAFDALIEFELLVSSDSSECADEDVFDQVLFELEAEFVEEHSAQLALIAAGDA